MEDSAGIYRTGDSLAKGVDDWPSCRSGSARPAWRRHSRTFNTELVAALELAIMLDVAEMHRCCPRCSARSRAARTSAPTSPRATTSASSPTRWSTATRTGHRRSNVCR